MLGLDDESNILERAINLACATHRKQKDLGGAPYICHPLAVMNSLLKKFPDNYLLASIGVCHDICEDSNLSPLQAAELLFEPSRPPAVNILKEIFTDALNLLTRNKKHSYAFYIERIRTQDDYARQVKVADLEHNLNLERLNLGALNNPTTIKRIKKYQAALFYLKNPACVEMEEDRK